MPRPPQPPQRLALALVTKEIAYYLQVTRDRWVATGPASPVQAESLPQQNSSRISTITLQSERVHVFKRDWVNATNLLGIAGRKSPAPGFEWKNQRFSWIRFQNTDTADGTYVPSEAAIVICELVELSTWRQHLHEIFEIRPGDLMYEYTRAWVIVRCGEHRVRLCRDSWKISLTGIFKAAGIGRAAQAKVRSSIPDGYETIKRGVMRGVYIGFNTVMKHCREYGLKTIEDTVTWLRSAELEGVRVYSMISPASAPLARTGAAVVDRVEPPHTADKNRAGTRWPSLRQGKILQISGGQTSSPTSQQASRALSRHEIGAMEPTTFTSQHVHVSLSYQIASNIGSRVCSHKTRKAEGDHRSSISSPTQDQISSMRPQLAGDVCPRPRPCSKADSVCNSLVHGNNSSARGPSGMVTHPSSLGLW